MRRLGVVLATAAILVSAMAIPASAAQRSAPAPATSVDDPVKLNILGEWAHPDDDTSIIGPCGVWHQYYTDADGNPIRCGIIMITRGEGGGNAVGTEQYASLGLRRENEDRAAHYRSGTVDIFNIDRVDFFYNTTAPLTQFFWNHDETLRRITRIIRETRPDIYIGFNPTLASGHGNHQQAGRFIWEGSAAAADAAFFPEQLTGPHALQTWTVKKLFSGGSTTGTGGTTASANCTTGFIPAATNLDTVVGAWTGYDSPYKWLAGNLQAQPAGTNKTWAQLAGEGGRAYPTQSRTQFQTAAAPGCSRFSMTRSLVPFQPNGGTILGVEYAGRDDAIFYGASKQDPGGLPLGTLDYLTFSRFFQVPGESFDVTLHARSGAGTLPAGNVTLTLPAGWTVDANPKPIGAIGTGSETTVTFTVMPPPATTAGRYKLAAVLSTGAATGYTDNVVEVVGAAEGRWQRIGKWSEYEQWVTANAPQALRLGRATALHWMGVGESKTNNVVVHNGSAVPQSGFVTVTPPTTSPANAFQIDAAAAGAAVSKPYGPLAPGADVTIPFVITNVDTTILNANTATPTNGGPTVGNSYTFVLTTTWAGALVGGSPSASENLSMSFVPTTTISAETSAPTVDGTETAGEYTGPVLNVGNIWEGGACSPVGTDCGTVGSPGSGVGTYARVSRFGDDLYFFVHVVDEAQAYAPTPAECVAHWLDDSVEILLDPRGQASEDALDTAHSFKLGVIPFSNDPTDTLGNGYPNGPCWERDADAHQGFANGALSIGNAPGVVVKSTAVWGGSNFPASPSPYAGGGYSLEIKIPLADLPAAVGPTSAVPTADVGTNVVDPTYMAINITPYDNDTNDHVDHSTRMAFSRFGSVQSDPYRWGHAYLPGYTPPIGSSPVYQTPIIPDSALQGEDSPQTIWQSAMDGVPFSGKAPATHSRKLSVSNVSLTPSSLELDLTAASAGHSHLFAYAGREAVIPVFTSSCVGDAAEAEPGMNACASTDGPGAAWPPDMAGRVQADQIVDFASAGSQHVSIPLTPTQYNALAAMGSLLIGWVPVAPVEPESQAFDIPLATPSVGLVEDNSQVATFVASVTGTDPFPGVPTGTVQFKANGVDFGAPVPLDGSGVATITSNFKTVGGKTITAVYSGDGDYASATSAGLPLAFYWKLPTLGTPNWNHATAGTVMPVRFTLGGNMGLFLFNAGWPESQRISCSTGAPLSTIKQSTSSAGLVYDQTKNRYTYQWITRSAWAGTCRSFQIELKGGLRYKIRVAFDAP